LFKPTNNIYIETIPNTYHFKLKVGIFDSTELDEKHKA